MTITRTLTALAAAASLAACASSPEDISAAYVSPAAYQAMNCNQLNAEASRINSRLAQATGQQQKAASNDAAMTAVSLILFWPAAFFIGGDKSSAAELGRIKGEAQAVQSAASQRGCQ